MLILLRQLLLLLFTLAVATVTNAVPVTYAALVTVNFVSVNAGVTVFTASSAATVTTDCC